MQKPLSEKELKLADSFLNTGDVQQSMLYAGYQPSTARKQGLSYLQKPHIKQYIVDKQALARIKANVTFEDKVFILVKIANACVMDDGSIDTFKARVSISAIQELNKMQGDLAPEKRVNVNVDSTLEKLRETRLEYKEY